MSYKDKLKPIATPTTYKSKLKPIATVSASPVIAPKPTKKVGYFGRIKAQVEEDAKTRAPKIREILQAGKEGKQSKLATGFQLGGQAIGGAFDAPFAAVEEAIPQFVKRAAKKAIFNPLAKGINLAADKISDIPSVQKFAMTDKGQEFARNVEAVPEYLNLIPAPKATKFIAKATEKTVGDLGVKAVGSFDKFAEQQAAKRATKAVKEIDSLAGKISQGAPEDIATFKKAVSNIEVKGVKTYKQLKDRISEKVSTLANKLDEVISKNPTTRTLANLGTVINTPTGKVQTNYVTDALAQLEQYFTKTNNLAGQAQVKGLLSKGNTSGLTIKEINDIARLHGRELSGFNANGELASGLSRQGAENTRAGLKRVARDLYGDKIFQEVDGEIASLISARDLVEKMETSVNKLKQKIMPRNLGQRAGRLAFQVANLFSFGGLKGFLEAALIPRGQGFKTLNAIDLEKFLSKNLKKMETLMDANLPENDLVRRLEDILQTAEQDKALLLPAAGQTGFPTRNTISLPQSARETNLGLDEVRGASINQSRTFPDNQPNTINASNTAQNVDIKPVIPRNDAVVDPYIPEDQLPVIQMGRLPRRKPISGPVVDYGTNPEVFTPENSSPFKKIKDYSVDGITYSEYKIPDQYPSLLTVAKSESGYRIQSIQVPENLQGQGIATRTYEALNKESLANTGYPLKSTITSKLSPSSKALWEKFVSNGKAKLHKGKTGFGDFYQFID